MFIFILGGLTGVMLASVPFNFQAHDSYFVVPHLHDVLIGGFVLAVVAALYYRMPHLTGRMMSGRIGTYLFWLMFSGFNLVFFMVHLTGLRGMPRRMATYPEGLGWDRLNMLSSIGSYILAAGIVLFVLDSFLHQRRGPLAPRNPWGAGTLEWLNTPITSGYNFCPILEFRSRAPLWDQVELTDRPAAQIDGALRQCPDHRSETIGSDPVTGEPIQIVRLPHPTWVPLIAALGVAFGFAATLASVYWRVAAGFAMALAGITAWVWEPSGNRVIDGAGIQDGLRLPVNVVDRRSHLHVAVIGTLIISFALFASVLCAGLYLWNTQPVFAGQAVPPAPLLAVLSLLGAAAVRGCGWLANRIAIAGNLFHGAGRVADVAGCIPRQAVCRIAVRSGAALHA